MSSFTHSKDVIGAPEFKSGSLDPDRAPLKVISRSFT